MQTLLASIFVLGILIFFHELGHFSAAKAVGIRVHEFSLGFGNKIFGIKRGDTDYNLRLFPLGGFVRMAGMDPDEEKEPDFRPEQSFSNKTVGQRALVIAAGPLMNFVLAVVLLAAIFCFHGVPVYTTQIGDVVKDSPAYHAGIKPGDKITSINNTPVANWNELIAEVNKYQGEELIIKLERENTTKELRVVPQLGEDDRYIIGIQADSQQTTVEKLGPGAAIWRGVQGTYQVSALIIDFLGKMLTGKMEADVGGPVKIVAEIGNAAEYGIFHLLQLAAILSINLGIFNLLPIPALDGSRLVFLAWEKVVGKPVDPAKEGFIHMIGFGLLLLLIIVITYNDILSLIASRS